MNEIISKSEVWSGGRISIARVDAKDKNAATKANEFRKNTYEAMLDIINGALIAAKYVTSERMQFTAEMHTTDYETRFFDLDLGDLVQENRVYLMSDNKLGFEMGLETLSPFLKFYNPAFITINGISSQTDSPNIYVSIRQPDVYNRTINEYLEIELSSCESNRMNALKLFH